MKCYDIDDMKQELIDDGYKAEYIEKLDVSEIISLWLELPTMLP